MNVNKLFRVFLGLPKTLIINFKYLPFKKALKIPIFVSNKVILKKLGGEIHIDSEVKTGMVQIGFGNVGIFDRVKSKSILELNGKIILSENINIGHGSKISIMKEGVLTLGKGFTINAESTILCNYDIQFGENCLISWDCLIMDTDFHKILDCNGNQLNKDNKIIIGSNVWVGCRSAILNGARVGDNIVIAANSTISKSLISQNILVGGSPARVLREGIYWER